MDREKRSIRRGIMIVLVFALVFEICTVGKVSRAASLSRPTVTVKKRTKKTATIKLQSKSKVTSYQVYLKQGKKGKFRIEAFAIGTSTVKLKKLKAKETYYVKVRSVRTSGLRFAKSKFLCYYVYR